MMNNLAYLKRESPFYDLFPEGMVPIINIIVPSQVELEGSRETEVYMVDLAKVGDRVVREIANRLAKKAGVDVMTVLGDFRERGLPLRVSQTDGASTDLMWFL